jgi:hypothetical protein
MVCASIAKAQTPSIASFDPWHGAPGAIITIAGNNLQTTQKVWFNNTESPKITIKNDWYIKATVPLGATTGKIKIQNAYGTYTCSTNFVVDALVDNPALAPTIAGFDPWHGVAGAVVNISGNNLQSTLQIWFNGIPASQVTVVNDWSVKATVPVGASTGKVKVTTTNGSYTTSSNFIIDGSGGGDDGGSGGGNGGGNPPADPIGFINPPAIDPPAGSLTGHPRLFIRQQDIPRLRNWANANNPIWQGILSLATNAKNVMDSGQLNSDTGYGGGNVSAPPESYAEFFAFLSVVHPDANARTDYANRAYTLFMKIINEAAKGSADGQPYRGTEFAINNRASWYGEAFPLTVDWIYDKFTASDKAKIRSVFLRWIQENLRANTTSQEHPQPLGVVNDPSLVDTARKVRWATNNYYTNHARTVGLLSMALDAGDDVPATLSDPPAGTLRRFVGNAIGAWLYTIHHFEKTDGAGGISPEGVGYGELSTRAVAFLLLAMHTAGVDNPQVYGTQAAAILSNYWQNEVPNGLVHILSPAKTVQESWIGASFLPYLFSDDSNYMITDNVRVLGSLAIYAMNTGDTQKYNKLRWMMDHTAPGGLANRPNRINSAFSGSSISLPIFYFLACDPAVTNAPDPRPSLPTEHFAPGLGILLSRTSWNQDAAWFTYKLSWNKIDHQFGDGNGIGFYRNGEWLTKNHAGYGSNIGSSDYQNTLAIQNPVNTNITFWQVNALRGSQWVYSPAGDPAPPSYNVTGDYTYVQGDATKLYNNGSIPASDVLHASRSVMYLKPDVMVVYDRAKSASAGRFKRFWLNTPTQAVINGKNATMTTASGQRLYMRSLLPLNGTLSSSPKESKLTYEPAQYEPMQFRFCVEDLSMPQEVHFLHVLQGADLLQPQTQSTLLQSSAGTPFEGAVVGGIAVLFKYDITTPTNTTTFTLPAGTTKCYLTGLAPNGGYSVTYQSVGGGLQVTVTTGGNLHADNGGVLTLP